MREWRMSFRVLQGEGCGGGRCLLLLFCSVSFVSATGVGMGIPWMGRLSRIMYLSDLLYFTAVCQIQRCKEYSCHLAIMSARICAP